jgi:hypothetical protein
MRVIARIRLAEERARRGKLQRKMLPTSWEFMRLPSGLQI